MKIPFWAQVLDFAAQLSEGLNRPAAENVAREPLGQPRVLRLRFPNQVLHHAIRRRFCWRWKRQSFTS
jgi:hypothetical protein